MKVFTRVLCSTILLILCIAIVDYFFNQGLTKYILIGLTAAVIVFYNEKKNRELKNTKRL